MLQRIKSKIRAFINSSVTHKEIRQSSQIEQVLISNQYKLMKNLLKPEEMPGLKDVGFKVFSQFEEDGLLLFIFSIIGTTNKKVVEICAGDGTECMAANLIINHGWDGLLFDGNPHCVAKGIEFFKNNGTTFLCPPVFRHEWLTRENINKLISDNGFEGTIDLLSLDVDGNDYYLMEAINVIQPRVIICETHNVIPGDQALTIPYKEDFFYVDGNQNEEFRSVSLLGMKKLLFQKGYRLIGAHQYGFNAIFIQNEIGLEYFPEVSIESVLDNSYTRSRVESVWNQVKDLPWVKI
jgi:hypothetical protein